MEVAHEIQRPDAECQNRDFDILPSFSRISEVRYALGAIIDGSDIAEVMTPDFRGNGSQWVELKGGFEAEVKQAEGNRFRIIDLIRIERGLD